MKKLTPFLGYAHETLESLKKCKFKVKENKSSGGFSVFMKNIIAVGPLPTKDYADAMAADFNDLVKIRIELISNALKVTEEKIKDVLTKSEGEVGDSLVSTRDGQLFVHGGDSGETKVAQLSVGRYNTETPKVDK